MIKSEEEKIKDREANKKYYLKNKEKAKEKFREYNKANYQKIKERKKQYYSDHSKQIKEYKKEYNLKNRDKIRKEYSTSVTANGKNYRKIWYINNREKILNTIRFKSYKITESEYLALFEKQNGKCAICNKDQAYFKYALCVDHDHITGQIRGLLCRNCNLILGNAKDNLNILLSAANYLEKYQQ